MAHLEGISSRVLIRKQTQGPKATPSTRVLSKKKQAPAHGVGATRALSSKSLKVAKLEKTVQKRAEGVLVQEDKAEIPKKRRSIQRLPLKEEANSEEQQADSPGREECFQAKCSTNIGQHLKRFENFCREEGASWPPKRCGEFLADFLDLEFIQGKASSEGEKLVAAVESKFASLRGKLVHSRRALKGWRKERPCLFPPSPAKVDLPWDGDDHGCRGEKGCVLPVKGGRKTVPMVCGHRPKFLGCKARQGRSVRQHCDSEQQGGRIFWGPWFTTGSRSWSPSDTNSFHSMQPSTRCFLWRQGRCWTWMLFTLTRHGMGEQQKTSTAKSATTPMSNSVAAGWQIKEHDGTQKLERSNRWSAGCQPDIWTFVVGLFSTWSSLWKVWLPQRCRDQLRMAWSFFDEVDASEVLLGVVCRYSTCHQMPSQERPVAVSNRYLHWPPAECFACSCRAHTSSFDSRRSY